MVVGTENAAISVIAHPKYAPSIQGLALPILVWDTEGQHIPGMERPGQAG